MDNSSTQIRQSESELRDWFSNYLSELLDIDPDDVDITIPFDRYGLDSSAAVGMTGDLEDWLDCELDPTLPYNYPTIEILSKHLAATN